MIIIGNVMALTVFDQATLSERYDNYLKNLTATSASPTFTREWYLGTSGGETPVKSSGITGLYHRFYKAEVPNDLVQQISFSSAFGTFMAGTSGDLVAAERSTKHGTWVARLLCSEKSSDYSSCEAQYQRGIYQGVDGKEITDKLELVEGGKTIDLATYKIASLSAPPMPVPAATPAPAMTTTVAPAAAPVLAAVPPAAPGITQQEDIAVQLEKLNELRSKGLITEDEFQQKRKQILDNF